jgi:uncharacterized membrane protein YkoI
MRIRAAALMVVLSASGAMASTPRISQGQASKIALARVPGTVVHEKLKHEKKKKKQHDHWNVKIAPREHARVGIVKKVEVDAETGEILKIKEVKAKAED